jgi:FMN phosphatase YigB (HAD superfamily)
MSRSLKICCLLGMLLNASGCSIKMLYNNADRFARWAANDYIQMNEAQEAYFTAEVDAIHYWHRTSELPRYADYLDTLPARFDEELEADDVRSVFETFYDWWEVFEAETLPFVTEMMLSLTDEQVERLPERLEKDNAKLAEDEFEKPLDEIQAEWMKEYSDTMSRFSGRLTKEQKAYLNAQSVRYVPQFELWSDYRERWQGDLLKLLREKRDDPDAFTEAFVALSKNRESYYGEELTAVFAANETLASEVTAWLINNLTDRQRERFYERIGEMATAFRELAAEVPEEIPEGGGCLVRC